MTKLPNERKCFLISPIGTADSEVRRRSDIMKRLIVERALVPKFVASVDRADDNFNPGEITPSIITSIVEADLIVADLTGANPNVYYEVAIAHAFGKPTIHIRHEGEKLPFDLKDVRVFEYGLDLPSGDAARESIERAASDLLDNGVVARTPVSGGLAVRDALQSPNQGDQIAAEMVNRMARLESVVLALGAQVALNTDYKQAYESARKRHEHATVRLQMLQAGKANLHRDLESARAAQDHERTEKIATELAEVEHDLEQYRTVRGQALLDMDAARTAMRNPGSILSYLATTSGSQFFETPELLADSRFRDWSPLMTENPEVIDGQPLPSETTEPEEPQA